jgi:hypothetical protein
VLLYVANLIKGGDARILRFNKLGKEAGHTTLDAVAWELAWNSLSHELIEVQSM